MAAPKGNQNAKKWTDEDLIASMEKSLEAAKKNPDVLCYYDAIEQGDIPYRTIEFAIEDRQHIVLQPLKKAIMAAIASKINRKALDGTFTAAPSIWRMKQLGESDKQEIMHTGDEDRPVSFKGIKFSK